MKAHFWYKINRPQLFMDWATAEYVEKYITGNNHYMNLYGPVELYDVNSSYEDENEYLSKSTNSLDDIIVANVETYYGIGGDNKPRTVQCTMRQFIEVKNKSIEQGLTVKINCLYSLEDDLLQERD